MRGYTKITTHNVRTGSNEIVEKHNMFTNAVSKMANFALTHAQHSANAGSPLGNPFTTHFHLVQGLALFDSTIPENANQVWLPAGVKATAYGAAGYANADANQLQLGTYNTSESDTSQPYAKKYVWDYATSQANGRHACACLTHIHAGLFGFGSSQGLIWGANVSREKSIALAKIFPNVHLSRITERSGNAYAGTVNSTYVDFCIDSDADVKYMFRVNSDGLSIVKHPMNIRYFDIFRSCGTLQPYEEESYVMAFTGTSFKHFYNTDEKMLYFWLNGSQYYANGTTFTIYKFDMVNKTLSVHGTWKNQSGKEVNGYLVVTATSVYALAHDASCLVYKYSFSLDSTTTPTGQTTANYTSQYYAQGAYILNGIVTFESGMYYRDLPGSVRDILVDTSDDTVRYSANRTSSRMISYTNASDSWYIPMIPPYASTQMVFGTASYEGDYMRDALTFENSNQNVNANTFTLTNYLATINNLPEVVVKTSDMTMKVEYSITADAEEE